ncbi:transcription cofactor vestigial-like protein 4 isoform X1 [Acipenser ruthenus]|uniref:transcription cofactor vestigial-like protein 4 isoform X1 n=1 Tax=Acipenser ruthenus TaxID=7906 RepID=UPI00145B5BE2|nr:transcription cofactor vestigial-like protein 4 isoform X1 [Acipenser ruthenus]
MAVANFHYITRMNSGFKVYILEGQPSMRAEDRYRQLSNHRTGHPPVYPIKRKYSPDRSQSVEERPVKVKQSPMALITRERALFGDATRSFQRESSRSPPERQAPPPMGVTAAMRRTNPVHRLPSPAYASPPMDEPLALIKKPGYCSPSEGSTATGTLPSPGARSPTARAQQMRPSVITCVSSAQRSSSKSPDLPSSCCPSAVAAPPTCDPVVEEHFRRSLGKNYSEANTSSASIHISVDDHFAKALGEKWLQIKATSPPNSPSCASSPARANSPHSPVGASRSRQQTALSP